MRTRESTPRYAAEMAAARREGDRLDSEQQPAKVVHQQLPRRLFNVGHDGPDSGERAALLVVRQRRRPEEVGAERGGQVGGGDVLLEISVHSLFICHTHNITYLKKRNALLDMQTKKQIFRVQYHLLTKILMFCSAA